MAVCLEYQSVYARQRSTLHSNRCRIVAAGLLLLVLVVKVWIKVRTTELGYDVARERAATAEFNMQRRELKLQLSVLTRPDDLSAVAQQAGN